MMLFQRKVLVCIFLIFTSLNVSLLAQESPTLISSCTYSDYGIFPGPDPIHDIIALRIQTFSDLAEIIEIQSRNPELYNDPPELEFNLYEYTNKKFDYTFVPLSNIDIFFEENNTINNRWPPIQVISKNGQGDGDFEFSLDQEGFSIPSAEAISSSDLIMMAQIQEYITGSWPNQIPKRVLLPILASESTENIIVGFPDQPNNIIGPGVNELDVYLRSIDHNITLPSDFDPDNPYGGGIIDNIPLELLEELFNKLPDEDLDFVTENCENSLSRDLILASHWCSVGDQLCKVYNASVLSKVDDVEDVSILIGILFELYGQILGRYHNAESCIHFWAWIRLGMIDDFDPDNQIITFTGMDKDYYSMSIYNKPSKDLETVAKICDIDLETELSHLVRVSDVINN